MEQAQIPGTRSGTRCGAPFSKQKVCIKVCEAKFPSASLGLHILSFNYSFLHIQHKIAEYNKSIPLIEDITPFIGKKKEVKIADIGAGPFSYIGSTYPGVKVEVYPSDKLDFTEFWKVRNQKPFIPVEVQNMEELTYPDEMFDIVFCHNALDHTNNAKKQLER